MKDKKYNILILNSTFSTAREVFLLFQRMHVFLSYWFKNIVMQFAQVHKL